VNADAFISLCGRYRYWLKRQWGEGRLLTFIMLNPSTADASVDDPTIRKCKKFAAREGFGGIFVLNLFAFRSSKPNLLVFADDPVGPENQPLLIAAARLSNETDIPIVCAWGANAGRPQLIHKAIEAQINMYLHYGARLQCLGTTADGHPRHPLYLADSTPLKPFTPMLYS
jgi:hypothetical protein